MSRNEKNKSRHFVVNSVTEIPEKETVHFIWR